VLALKPQNVAKISPTECSASAARELQVLDKGDAMNSFANVLHSIKEKFGERASDAREIVVGMAGLLDKHKGHASLAVQQDDEQGGVLLHPMQPAAEAPGRNAASDYTMLVIYRSTKRSEPNLQLILEQFAGDRELKIAQVSCGVRHCRTSDDDSARCGSVGS
jgi:hypothetical protein